MLYLAPFGLALALYWPTLSLPLVYDTILHTQLTDGMTWQTVWLPSDRFGFYRPLVFAPMLLIEQLFDGYPAVLLHALSVGQHALNSLLLSMLVWRVWQSYRLSLLSGLLLACYPFSYQAAIVYGNNAYLTVSGLVLFGLIVYAGKDGARTTPTIRRTAAVVAIFITGVLVHEMGILLAPLCLLLNLLQSKTENLKSKIQTLLFHPSSLILISATTLYLIIYLFLPTGSGPLLDYGGNELRPKLLIGMQSAAYPLVWLGRPLLSWLQLLVTGSFLITIGTALWVGWLRPGLRRPLIFGAAWWLCNSVLISTTLPSYYIADGARLLYFGGVGMALVWGCIVTAPLATRPSPRAWVGSAVSAVLLIVMLVSGGQFITEKIAQYQLASESINTVSSALSEAADDDGFIVVNFTQWVSPQESYFVAGNEWAPIMGDHLFLAELFRANEGREFKATSLVVPSLLGADTAYNYGLFQARVVDQTPLAAEVNQYHLFISRYRETAIETDYTGRIIPDAGVIESLPRAVIGPYQFLTASAEACDEVYVKLELKVTEPVPPTASLFVQLLAPDGRLIGQKDGPPLGLPPARVATTENTVLIDQRTLTYTEGEPAQLLVGLYDYISGERFTALDENQRPLPDNIWRITPSPCGS